MTTDEKKGIAALAYIFLTPFGILWWTWTIKILWLWTVVPTWKLDTITMGQAFAIYLLGNILTFHRRRFRQGDSDDQTALKDTISAIICMIFAPLVWLAVGLIAKSFI